jgi:hypothetical protein
LIELLFVSAPISPLRSPCISKKGEEKKERKDRKIKEKEGSEERKKG